MLERADIVDKVIVGGRVRRVRADELGRGLGQREQTRGPLPLTSNEIGALYPSIRGAQLRSLLPAEWIAFYAMPRRLPAMSAPTDPARSLRNGRRRWPVIEDYPNAGGDERSGRKVIELRFGASHLFASRIRNMRPRPQAYPRPEKAAQSRT